MARVPFLLTIPLWQTVALCQPSHRTWTHLKLANGSLLALQLYVMQSCCTVGARKAGKAWAALWAVLMGRKGQASDGPGPQPGGIEVLLLRVVSVLHMCRWAALQNCGGVPQAMAAPLFLSLPFLHFASCPAELFVSPCKAKRVEAFLCSEAPPVPTSRHTLLFSLPPPSQISPSGQGGPRQALNLVRRPGGQARLCNLPVCDPRQGTYWSLSFLRTVGVK